MEQKERPFMVTLIAILFFVSAVGSSLSGFVTAGPVGLLAGIIPLIIGFGFYKGWAIMWYLGVLFSVLGVILNLFAIITVVAIVPLIVNAVILFYLFKDNVKGFFLD